MPLFQLLLIAVIQGITEFLPVSSSGHLILLPIVMGTTDQGLALDVAVHVGTLAAVILYFRADVGQALVGTAHVLTGRRDTQSARLAMALFLATIPVIVIGLAIKLTGLDQMMRNITVIGWTMLLFGLLLYWSDKRGQTAKTAQDWTLRDAVIMGFWQAVALIPGTSRSGITITAARLLGYNRRDAARLSMLMSIPTILASGSLLGLEVAQSADMALLRDAAIAAFFAFLAALLALFAMMQLLKSTDYTPYVIYRVILGIVLLGVAYTGIL